MCFVALFCCFAGLSLSSSLSCWRRRSHACTQDMLKARQAACQLQHSMPTVMHQGICLHKPPVTLPAADACRYGQAACNHKPTLQLATPRCWVSDSGMVSSRPASACQKPVKSMRTNQGLELDWIGTHASSSLLGCSISFSWQKAWENCPPPPGRVLLFFFTCCSLEQCRLMVQVLWAPT